MVQMEAASRSTSYVLASVITAHSSRPARAPGLTLLRAAGHRPCTGQLIRSPTSPTRPSASSSSVQLRPSAPAPTARTEVGSVPRVRRARGSPSATVVRPLGHLELGQPRPHGGRQQRPTGRVRTTPGPRRWNYEPGTSTTRPRRDGSAITHSWSHRSTSCIRGPGPALRPPRIRAAPAPGDEEALESVAPVLLRVGHVELEASKHSRVVHVVDLALELSQLVVGHLPEVDGPLGCDRNGPP